MSDRSLRVGIDARFPAGGLAGGIEQFTIGLVRALGQLEDGDEHYVVMTHRESAGWLRPYMGANQSEAPVAASQAQTGTRVARRTRTAMQTARTRLAARSGWRRITPANEFFKSLNLDLVHFTHQSYKATRLPTVYNPHDLQHVHFPAFFPGEAFTYRESRYRAGCRAATAVVADGRWSQNDIARHYHIAATKLYSIMMGPPTEAYDPPPPDFLDRVRRRWNLPDRFALYPAQTWPHKNHIGLARALRRLRDRDGVMLHVVCTGRQNDYFPTISDEVASLGVAGQMHFLGFLPPEELRALYRLAEFVVFPSLFEGGGLPILEAFHERVAVASSDVTTLPEYAGGAALLFNPTDTQAIADALRRMHSDEELRSILVGLGSERLRTATWEGAARTYRALYRLIAGVRMSDVDVRLVVEARADHPDPAGIDPGDGRPKSGS